MKSPVTALLIAVVKNMNILVVSAAVAVVALVVVVAGRGSVTGKLA